MIRTNIYLSSWQHKAVVKEAKKLGVTASEVIRDLIDEGLLQRDYELALFKKDEKRRQKLQSVPRSPDGGKGKSQ